MRHLFITKQARVGLFVITVVAHSCIVLPLIRG